MPQLEYDTLTYEEPAEANGVVRHATAMRRRIETDLN